VFLIREVMHCRPGKAGEIVKRFKQIDPIMKELGFRPQRVLTDMSGERYWTVVSEQEVETLEQYLEGTRTAMGDARAQKIMDGYHDFVDHGRREIFKIE
jgi:hypothetical protein